MGAVVSRVEPGSVAARYGIVRNDEIITINGQLLRDIIDYYFVTSEHKLEINYLRDGFPRTTVIHKNPEEQLGLDFSEEVFDSIIPCRNKCIFCFVDQLPKGVRKTMCIKDDDYRLSFLHGNYITLTNLAENDLRRITAMRLSPLYVSIHATDPEVRSKLMGNPQAANIMKILTKLKLHNIQCHTQIVVVPGVNDGQILRKTLSDLLNLYPTVKTVAIVPVGLTGHREDLPDIKPFDRKEAQDVHRIVTEFQEKAQKRLRFPFFYMADEIYLLMETDFPPHKHYGYYDQLSNGVGMGRKLHTDFNRRRRFLPKKIDTPRNVWIVTGMLGERILFPLMESFSQVENLKTRLIAIKNSFFGPVTTVTGLLAGQDVIAQLKSRMEKGPKPDVILLPDVVLREGRFLDDVSVEEIAKELDTPVEETPADAIGLIEGILGDQKKPVHVKAKTSVKAGNSYDSEELPLDEEEVDHQQAPNAKPLRPTGAEREPKADWSKDYQPRRPRIMSHSRKNQARNGVTRVPARPRKSPSPTGKPVQSTSPPLKSPVDEVKTVPATQESGTPVVKVQGKVASRRTGPHPKKSSPPQVKEPETARAEKAPVPEIKTERPRRGRRPVRNRQVEPSAKPAMEAEAPPVRENIPIQAVEANEPVKTPDESAAPKAAVRHPRRRYRPRAVSGDGKAEGGTTVKDNNNAVKNGVSDNKASAAETKPAAVNNKPNSDGADKSAETAAAEKGPGPGRRRRKSPRREQIV